MFRRRVIPIAIGFAVFATAAYACNIPVFRYALERWKPDVAEIVVFTRGELSKEDATWVKALGDRTIENGGHLNANVIRVDLAVSDDSTRDDSKHLDLWRQLSTFDAGLPHLVVRSKIGRARWISHWHGPIDEAKQLGIITSPLRDQLKERLLAGHSVVWLLVQSDDESKTDAAKQLLDDTFKSLQRKVQLPEGIGLPGSELYADVPLVLRFSTLRSRVAMTRKKSSSLAY